MTSGGGRRRGRGQRLLYFFRTPPGVRVGRAPIDEDAIRLLEEHNPDVQFDWTRILKQPPGTQQHAPDRRDERREPRRNPPLIAQAAPVTGSGSAEADLEESAEPEEAQFAESAESAAPQEFIEPLETAEPLEPLEPAEPEEPTGSPDSSLPPRYARLGAEGLARLRARYAEAMARITEKSVDEHAREELRTKAERLNPDAWVTEAEVAAALEQYETVFEDLRPVVGRQPRRRRRRRV